MSHSALHGVLEGNFSQLRIPVLVIHQHKRFNMPDQLDFTFSRYTMYGLRNCCASRGWLMEEGWMYTSATPSFQAGRAAFPADSSFTAALGYSAAHKAAFTCSHAPLYSGRAMTVPGLGQLDLCHPQRQ